MDPTLKALFESGRTLLADTKMPRKLPTKSQKVSKSEAMGAPTPAETDPYKVFIKKCVLEKPKKKEVLDSLKRFIVAAEAEV
jgi:hypothetical protein